jgi:hypothetical protein
MSSVLAANPVPGYGSLVLIEQTEADLALLVRRFSLFGAEVQDLSRPAKQKAAI